MSVLLSLLLRSFVVLTGLIFAASMAFAFAMVLVAWTLRVAWARLMGRTRPPAVRFRYRTRENGLARRLGDVVDVEARKL